MTKLFRPLVWTYLAGYTFGLLAMLGLDIYVERFNISMLVWWVPLLIPAVVLFRAMRGNRAHWVFHVVGILVLLNPILGAHQFASLEGITLGMYIWFLPMVLAMFYFVFYRVENET